MKAVSVVPAVIAGDRSLPTGYEHPHASEQARAIASAGMFLRVLVGSGVHGITVDDGNDDRDEMGICLEPAAFVTGLARVPNGVRGEGERIVFEQYERHTAWDRAGGLAERSGAGDLDVVVYSARKWCRLALAGNPTVLIPLFVPDVETMLRTAVGCELVANADRITRAAARRQRLAASKGGVGEVHEHRQGRRGRPRSQRPNATTAAESRQQDPG